ncbi:hypothetical protein LBMAG24_23100 [Bacteroidota bacterium]|nr:hypothetical protein LBMAG24_23100 [Bacteroidota bacterium]
MVYAPVINPCQSVDIVPEVYVLLNGMAVPSLYLETFKFSLVQHCEPIKTVLYGFPSISKIVDVIVDVPQVNGADVTVIVPVAFTLPQPPVKGIT